MSPLKTLLPELAEAPNPERFERVVALLARKAAGTKYPKKSISACLRESSPQDLSKEMREELEEAALERLSSPTPTPSASLSESGWASLEEAAPQLGVTPTTLARRLRSREYRRLYGWPWFDGRSWKIPRPVLYPETRAAFMGILPVAEPQPDLLPADCQR